MKFMEAKKKLEKMAKGEYHSLTYEITEYSNNVTPPTVKCTTYINGQTHLSASTWKESLKLMEVAINPPKKKPMDLKEAPEEDIIEIKEKKKLWKIF